jgi:5,10-methenyltetrahydromethanopterin hydrogenase
LATIRRRKAARIETAIIGLEKRANRDDFEAYTFKVVEDIRDLLIQLAEVHREGNTREILRQIRDTFLDGGHEQYKKPHVRILVASVFQKLAEADEVTPEDVDRTWDELYDNEINAGIPAVMVVESQEDVSNA